MIIYDHISFGQILITSDHTEVKFDYRLIFLDRFFTH